VPQQKWVPGIFPLRYRWPERRANNFTTFMCQLSWNLVASTYWNPQGLSRTVHFRVSNANKTRDT